MTNKHYLKYTFVIMGFLVLIAAYIQYSIAQNTETLHETEVHRAEQYAKRIADHIKDSACTPLSSCLDNSISRRANLNKTLHAFKTDIAQNIFVLYRDKKNNFRFLLDGSQDAPAEYQSIFFPESDEFNIVYNGTEPKIIEQKGVVKEVWLSLLYPIIDKHKTVALLILDLSETYGKSIQDFNSPLLYIVYLLQFFTLFSIAFLGYLVYNSYKLRKSILIDPISGANTKLYRKEYFDEEQANRFDYILLDIDKFAQINERFDRDTGDQTLKLFVSFLKSLLPKDSKIIRNHGAEFLLILEKGKVNITHFTKILFDKLSEKQYLAGGHLVGFSLSMCAAKTPDEATSYYDMEHILDKKLLEIKNLGKNRLAVLDNISHIDIKYKDMDHVKRAIDGEQLVCLFQPIYRADSKQIYKYEALVRIIDEDEPSKLILPHYFMDLIKDSVHYIRLSKWVIKNAFKLLRENVHDHISVNMDLSDLYNEEMMSIIQNELYENKDLAKRLTFEILEHHEITDFDHISLIFKQLKKYGSKIAIDDFGSGYSNFTYLARLNIDIIKIDGALINALEINTNRVRMIIKMINDMGVSQNIKIVAEHVSSKEIHDILMELNVEYLQGFYLGEPRLWEAYHPSV